MSNGQAITVAPHDLTLTTQEAADLLGISRPTLVKLLEEGRMPTHNPAATGESCSPMSSSTRSGHERRHGV